MINKRIGLFKLCQARKPVQPEIHIYLIGLTGDRSRVEFLNFEEIMHTKIIYPARFYVVRWLLMPVTIISEEPVKTKKGPLERSL